MLRYREFTVTSVTTLRNLKVLQLTIYSPQSNGLSLIFTDTQQYLHAVIIIMYYLTYSTFDNCAESKLVLHHSEPSY